MVLWIQLRRPNRCQVPAGPDSDEDLAMTASAQVRQ